MKNLYLLALLLSPFVYSDQTLIPDYDSARDDYIHKKLYKNGGKTFYYGVKFNNRADLQVEHIFPVYQHERDRWLAST